MCCAKSAVSFVKNLKVDKFFTELKGLDDIYYNHIHDEIRFIKLSIYPEDTKNYYELKTLIFQNINRYSDSEKLYHTSRLLIYITNHFKKANEKLIYEIAEIRKFQLKNIS